MENENKHCRCEGLVSVIQMLDAYDLWLRDMNLAQEPFHWTSKLIMNNLNEEAYKPNYKEILPEIQPILRKIQLDYREALETGQFTQVMERIRDQIHFNATIRQMVTCGPPYNGHNETEDSKSIFRAMETFAEETPKEAKEILVRHHSEITCEK